LLAICAGGPVQLFRNVAPRRGHWLSIRALDPSCGNRDSIGAEVTVEAGAQRLWGLVQPSCSYLVSHDPRVHFGLGPITAIERVRVIWPDGTEEAFPGGAADRFLTVRKGEGREP
jgi:enediyne biosynthesis protein E4